MAINSHSLRCLRWLSSNISNLFLFIDMKFFTPHTLMCVWVCACIMFLPFLILFDSYFISFFSQSKCFVWRHYLTFIRTVRACVRVCVPLLFPSCCTDSFESSTGKRLCFLRAEYKQITSFFNILVYFFSPVTQYAVRSVHSNHSYSTRCFSGTKHDSLKGQDQFPTNQCKFLLLPPS